MKGNRVKHIRCAPYHPSSNGAVERFNQTFKQAQRASSKDGRTLSHRLADFLLTYRSTPHATTNRTPSSLFLNRELHTRLSLVHPDVTKQVLDKQADQVATHNQHAKARQVDVGQSVMVRNLRPSGPKWIPGTVLKQTGPLSYIVQVNSGLVWKRHIDHIRLSISDVTPKPSLPPIMEDDDLPVSTSPLEDVTPTPIPVQKLHLPSMNIGHIPPGLVDLQIVTCEQLGYDIHF